MGHFAPWFGSSCPLRGKGGCKLEPLDLLTVRFKHFFPFNLSPVSSEFKIADLKLKSSGDSPK